MLLGITAVTSTHKTDLPEQLGFGGELSATFLLQLVTSMRKRHSLNSLSATWFWRAEGDCSRVAYIYVASNGGLHLVGSV